MTDEESDRLEWRAEMVAELDSGDVARSTRALLALTYNDPERPWLEDLLLDQLRGDNDRQLRMLAVTCMGHLGRIHGVVGGRIVARLRDLLSDKQLGGVAEDALGDIAHFATVIDSGPIGAGRLRSRLGLG